MSDAIVTVMIWLFFAVVGFFCLKGIYDLITGPPEHIIILLLAMIAFGVFAKGEK